MILAFSIAGCIFAGLAIWVATLLVRDPEWRVTHGRVLSTLHDENGITRNSLAPDAKCALCCRGNLNTVVRNRWQKDLPVCQGCVTWYNDTEPRKVVPMTRIQTRRSLDAPDAVGKPMPRF